MKLYDFTLTRQVLETVATAIGYFVWLMLYCGAFTLFLFILAILWKTLY